MIPTREDLLMSTEGNVLPQYLGSGDPALKDYYPAWLDNMADDATVEGSMLDGVVQGAEAVRSVVLTIRSLYDRQEHKFAGPYSNNGFLEDYVAEVYGEPIGCVVLVTYNAAGQTQHVVASYRPRSSLLLFSRLLGEKFAGTAIAKQGCWRSGCSSYRSYISAPLWRRAAALEENPNDSGELELRAARASRALVRASSRRCLTSGEAGVRNAIVEAARELLENPKTYQAMARVHNPYGDGRASARIGDVIHSFLREKTLGKLAFSEALST